jgi:guanylate kinase
MTPFPLILSAPSGGGKTTIARLLLDRRSDVGYSVSATTRVPRSREVNGVDYYFWSREEFVAAVGRGEFAEWATVHGHLYGTLKREVDRILGSGRHVVMDIDVQGARQFAAAVPAVLKIFLVPPSVAVLVERLRARNTEDGEAMLVRLKTARQELQEAVHYDYTVLNDTLDHAYQRVSEIIDREAARRVSGGSPSDADGRDDGRQLVDQLIPRLTAELDHQIDAYSITEAR